MQLGLPPSCRQCGQHIRALAGLGRLALSEIGYQLDVFFSGGWWWRVPRWWAGRRIHAVLNHHDDTSIEAKRATDKYEQWDFAVRYGRHAPAVVRRVIEIAKEERVPVEDLRLIVLSNDLHPEGGSVVLRRPAVIKVLSVLSAMIVCAGWLELTTVTMAQYGSPLLKLLVICVVTCICAVTWRGWSLWLSRPEKVIDRWLTVITRACADTHTADVVALGARRASSDRTRDE